MLLTSDRIPARHSLEPFGPTPLVTSNCNIIEHARIFVQNRVQKSKCPLPDGDALVVDECDDGGEGRRRGGGSISDVKVAVDGNNVRGAVGGNIGKATGCSAVVVLSRSW